MTEEESKTVLKWMMQQWEDLLPCFTSEQETGFDFLLLM